MASSGLPSSAPPLRSLRHWWPWVGLFVGVALTLIAWLQLGRVERERLRDLERNQTSVLVERIEQRMTTMKVVLQGAARYLGRGALPSRAEWHDYVESLNLPATYPGIQGLGFAEWIPKAETDSHIQRIRQGGFPDYQILPGGPLPADPDGCGPVVYLEPMDMRNLRALGKDMLRETVRREAMLRARDSGLPALSGKVVLYQEGEAEEQVGTLLYVPVFRQGWPLGTVIERRQAFRGWTSQPFRMGDLLGALLAREIKHSDVELYDGIPADPAHLLFDSDPSKAVANEVARSFEVAGRTWTIHVQPSPSFYASVGQRRHLDVLAWGLLASLLLFALLKATLQAEARARWLANQRGEELLATESKFRALFEKAPMGMALVDSTTGHFLSVNARLGEILGYTPDELLTRSFLEVTHPAHREVDAALIHQVAQGEVAEARWEKRYLHHDGQEVWGRLTLAKIPTEPGAPPRHLTMVEDITESHRIKESLQASEQRFRDMFELSPDPITLSRLSDGTLVMANPAWCELTGLSLEESLGRSPADLGAWPDPGAREALVQEIQSKGFFTAREAVLRHRDGTVRQVLLTARTMHQGHQGTDDLILVLGKDVSVQHRAMAALKASETRYQGLFDLSPDGVSVTRLKDGALIEVNAAWEAMLGYTREEAIGRSTSDLGIYTGTESRQILLDQLEATSAISKFTLNLQRKDGTPLLVEANGRVLDVDDEPCLVVVLRDETQRELMKKAIEESEHRFRTVVEESPVALLIHRKGRFVYLNPAAMALVGAHAPEDILGHPVLERIHPEDVEVVKERMRLGVERGLVAPLMEERFYTVDGRVLDAEVEARPILFEGQPATLVFAHDITERKAAEAALRTSEARLRILGDHLLDSFLYQLHAPAGGPSRFIYLSAGVERLCGLKAEDVMKDASLLFGQMDPLMVPAYLEAEAASARELKPFAMEVRQRRNDGAWRWFRVRSTPRIQPDGGVIWEGIATDVTEQKTTQLLLEESRNRFQDVVDNAGDAIFLNDAEGRIFLCNQAACTSTGYEMEELLRLRVQDFDAEFHSAENVQISGALQPGQQVSIPARHRRKDGSTFPVEVRLTILRDAAPRRLLAVVRDLSQRERIEESLHRAHKAESLVLMAGGIAHDFNNLFQAILGYLEIATAKVGDPATLKPLLDKAVGTLQKAIGLSWKMLDFSGRGFLKVDRLDLQAWLPVFLATLRQDLPSSIQLEVSCVPVPLIQGDPSKLEEIVKALVDNAREALGSSGGRIRLSLYPDLSGDQGGLDGPGIWPLHRPDGPMTVCLDITDDGPGVATEKLGVLCDPFYSTKGLGRGLGLAATVGILRAHRAGFHILNGPEKGLTLRMHFSPLVT